MNASTLLAALAVLLALPPAPARAGGISVPDGFNVESAAGPGPTLALMDDGSRLLLLGDFGAQRLERLAPGGPLQPFATGFGSVAGVACSPVTGDVVVGDSLGPTLLWLCRDGNGDGDALDPGETVPHPVQPPVLGNGEQPLPFDLAFRPGSDELYLSGSTSYAAPPVLGVVLRIAGGAASVHGEGFGLPAGLAFDGDALLLADLDALTFAGRVWRLLDGNGDDDALDPGEAGLYADGLSGANDLVRAADGSCYLSGTFDTAAGFVPSVARLLPDGDGDGASDGVDEAWASGFPVFTTSLVLLEGPGGLLPGVAGEGELLVSDFGLPASAVVRSAPFATVELAGAVADNSRWTVTVSGTPGADAFLVVSLDTSGSTLPGIGDLCAGFALPHEVAGPLPLNARGHRAFEVFLHGQAALVGLELAFQGAVLEQGALGLAAALIVPIAP